MAPIKIKILVIQRAKRMHRAAICGLPGSTIFSHIS